MITNDELKALGFSEQGFMEVGESNISIENTDLYLGGPDACVNGHCFRVPNVDSVERLKEILLVITPHPYSPGR